MLAKPLLSVGLLVSLPCFGAANITILNGDAAGEGFNDPTPVAPVGGNTGTTLGQQRLKVFERAAQIWGATLTSFPTIAVLAGFNPEFCNANSATLGAAGPTTLFRDPTGAVLSPANTWFHVALANKLASTDLTPNPEIIAVFNSNLGGGGVGVGPGCGFTFYLGLDNNAPPGQTDLLTVVLHELGHGLGFSTTTDEATGQRLAGFNHKYDTFLFDTTQNLSWPAMTDAQRAASAANPRGVVWTGPIVTGAVPTVLSAGTPELVVSAPGHLAGTYLASAFQGATSALPNLTFPGVTAEVMPALDGVAPFTDACEAITPASALGVNGKIALVDRGTCPFNIKLANVAAAGGIGVIFANNGLGSPPPITGANAEPAIPSLIISLEDGAALRDFLRFRSRTSSGLLATLRLNTGIRAGADPLGRALIFTPSPIQPGSSLSHWDPIAFRNQLMEPFFSLGLTHSVMPPQDLTFPLLRDLGW